MLIDSTVDALEKFSDQLEIETVNMVRLNDVGVFQIEVKTMWASKDVQPNISYEIISFLSKAWYQMSKDTLIEISGSSIDNFYVEIVTYSTNGDYRYYSLTDYDLMNKLYKKPYLMKNGL